MGRNSQLNITITRETIRDYHTVEQMTREAFWNLYVPGCDEHYLVHIMRAHPDFIPDMDYVAQIDHKIVGNIMVTKSYVVNENNDRVDTITFGPISVLPGYQRQGIGTALINHTTKIAHEKGVKAIIILGHPHNYCKHGFKSTKDFNISDGEGRFPFGQLVLELEKGVFEGGRWKFHTSPVFDLDQKAVQVFDRQFPPKNKEYKYSQEEFSMAIRAYL